VSRPTLRRLSITGTATLQLTSSTLQRVQRQPERRDVEFEFRSVRQRASRHVKVLRDKLSPVEAARLANQRGSRERLAAWLAAWFVRWLAGTVDLLFQLSCLRQSLFSYLLSYLRLSFSFSFSFTLSLSFYPSLHMSPSVSSSIFPFLPPARSCSHAFHFSRFPSLSLPLFRCLLPPARSAEDRRGSRAKKMAM